MTWVLLVLTLGVNPLFWTAIGALRWAAERTRRGQPAPPGDRRIRPDQVAVLVAAHNEELGVGATVAAAHAQVPRGNVFVVSDGSSDQTVLRAQQAGASVYDLHPNRGKAGALAAGIGHFALRKQFEAIMLLDADTAPAPDYLQTGLPQFDDPDVVAVAGRAATVWERGSTVSVGQYLRAYRERQYVTFQLLFKYGQAARLMNAVTIVPGFASMYRTRILDTIDIAAPGLVIEDFNMTFEVHARRLGRIAFHPRAAVAYTQDPYKLRDYMKQVRRWSLGFWQTLRRHGLHHGRFWYLLAAFVAELLTSSVLFALLGPALLLTTAAELWAYLAGTRGPIGQLAGDIVAVLPPRDIFLGVVVPDYLLTVLVAGIQRRPAYLLLGLGFVPLRCIDAWLCLRSLWASRSAQSVGTWKSPERRAPAGSPVLSAVEATAPPPTTPSPPTLPSHVPPIPDGSPPPIPNPRATINSSRPNAQRQGLTRPSRAGG